MLNTLDYKNFALITEGTPVHLKAYDPDTSESYLIDTDVRSVQTILNYDPRNADMPRANFTTYQAYHFAKSMSDELVDSIICSGYFMLPANVKEEQHIKFNIFQTEGSKEIEESK